MININSKAIEGLKFTALDPNTEYTCVGYASNETFLIVGAHWDQASNRTTLKTFKLQDVKFMGGLNPF